jgi:hypothetical protein
MYLAIEQLRRIYRMKQYLTIAALAALLAPAAFSAPVYGTFIGAGNQTGFRTEGVAGQLDVDGNYASDGKTFRIDWNIGFNAGTGLYSYQYTLTGFGPPALSHLILDLSPNCSSTANCVQNLSITSNGSSFTSFNTEYGTFGQNGGSNPNINGSVQGIKINMNDPSTPIVISFNSLRDPVWGDFYFKGGSSSSIQNLGLGNTTSSNINNYIAVPDTTSGTGFGSPVPEPGSMLLMGSGLVAASLATRRRMRQQ